jgi:hypothetical protein
MFFPGTPIKLQPVFGQYFQEPNWSQESLTFTFVCPQYYYCFHIASYGVGIATGYWTTKGPEFESQ